MYGKIFVVKYVLPKLTTSVTPVPAVKTTPDLTSKYLGRRDVWDQEQPLRMHGLKYSRSANEKKTIKKEPTEVSKTKAKKSKIKTQISKTPPSTKGKKRHYAQSAEHTDNASKKSITGTNDLSQKSAKEVLNAIGPASASLAPRQQNDVIEAFPRDGIAENRPTHIIFSAEDPLKKYELLINGKKNLTIIIDTVCRTPHILQLVITKRPFTSKCKYVIIINSFFFRVNLYYTFSSNVMIIIIIIIIIINNTISS